MYRRAALAVTLPAEVRGAVQEFVFTNRAVVLDCTHSHCRSVAPPTEAPVFEIMVFASDPDRLDDIDVQVRVTNYPSSLPRQLRLRLDCRGGEVTVSRVLRLYPLDCPPHLGTAATGIQTRTVSFVTLAPLGFTEPRDVEDRFFVQNTDLLFSFAVVLRRQ